MQVYKWGNTSGGVGILGLNTRDMEVLQELRLFISRMSYKNATWTTFPKNAVLKRFNLTTMLRGDIAAFPLGRLPFALFGRNPTLDGNLTVIKSKVFSASSQTKNGQSMEGWTLVTMQGCDLFMEHLARHAESYRLQLGKVGLFIRGGKRNEDAVTNLPQKKNKEKWSQQQEQQRQHIESR